MGDLTKDFSRREFASVFEGVVTPAPLPAVQRLADNLQVLRDRVGRSITITSGYRTPAHNASVGGASSSRHMKGDAADFTIAGLTPNKAYCMTEALIGSGMRQGGLGAYVAHTHYDTRGYKARWTTGVPAPECRGVILPEEDADMAVLLKVTGQGSKVWVHSGGTLTRVASGAALARLRTHGIVSKAPAKVISAAAFKALQADLGLI